MPIRTIRAADAYESLKDNPYAYWPKRGDPDNRFSHLASPAFTTRFMLEPGQRIFTIGSCFARNVERVLAERGFHIPALDLSVEAAEWGGNPEAVLNNYVPAAIAPQIRWAFGFEKFDLALHAGEVRTGRFVDLQLNTTAFRPMPGEMVMKRRERLGAMYRQLASSHAVIITLGFIEAWFDNRSGLYINASPLKSLVDAEPDRFELHVLDYGDVLGSLRDLMGLLDRVCPSDYRVVFTVSPIPITATFTGGDVAVANSYSKSVLRAAVEALIAEQSRADYFPSYESVVLTERHLVWKDDQIHVTNPVIRFNVDRMIRRYVGHHEASAIEVANQARELRKSGQRAEALKLLQQEWAKRSDSQELTIELAEMHLAAGDGEMAERLLTRFLETGSDAAAHLTLARYYNHSGRYTEAAVQAETAARLGMGPSASLERIAAYYHLGRLEEGLAVLEDIRDVSGRRPALMSWRARYLDRLERADEAEDLHRKINAIRENPQFMLHYAQFLASRGRSEEALEWLNKALLLAPHDAGALTLRAALQAKDKAGSPPAWARLMSARLRSRVTDWAQRAIARTGLQSRSTEQPESSRLPSNRLVLDAGTDPPEQVAPRPELLKPAPASVQFVATPSPVDARRRGRRKARRAQALGL